jgi:hypothetical protein
MRKEDTMRYLAIMTLSVLLSFPTSVFANTVHDKVLKTEPTETATKPETGQKNEAKREYQAPELAFAGKEQKDFLIKMGGSLKILATGDFAARIKKESSAKITLYLNGVPMTNLTPSLIQNPAGTEVTVTFDLVRDSNNNDNRKAWDLFLKKEKGYSVTLKPAISVGNDLPREVYSSQPIKFYIASDSAIFLTLFISLVILFVAFFLLIKYTSMLCDEGTGYYSLGKSQMAFWGLLVLLAFTGVWVLTGTMERIPPQVLILLGISGATGLSAVLIGNGKKSEIQNSIEKLQKEKQDLLAKQAQTQPPLSDIEQKRLDAIGEEIKALSEKIQPGESKNFWRDICDDGNGASFHRLQVVIWTIVLGAVFIRSVADVMSMPEFSETLLILMGISSGTYLGFKIPEK